MEFLNITIPKLDRGEKYKHTFIYVLYDLTKNEPFYVGKTKNPHQRLIDHKKNSIKIYAENSNKYIRIKEILEKDPNGIEMRILEIVKEDSFTSIREKFWVQEIGNKFKIVNIIYRPYNGI